MSRLADAAQGAPFSNATEGDEWMSKWCEFCVHDHCMHDDGAGPGCELIGLSMATHEWPGEAWLPEPDDGLHFLPSRLVCLRFEPCHAGNCTGDPGAEAREWRVLEVTAYWREHAGRPSPTPAGDDERNNVSGRSLA